MDEFDKALVDLAEWIYRRQNELNHRQLWAVPAEAEARSEHLKDLNHILTVILSR